MALRERAGVILSIGLGTLRSFSASAPSPSRSCGNRRFQSFSCPRTHQLIVEAFQEAGFPEGIISLVTNAPADTGEIVGALIDLPAVPGTNFTGSTAVGLTVARRASEHSRPVLLEPR